VQSTILGSFATVVPCTRCRGEGSIIANPCETCQGSGRIRATRERTIKIPAGVDTGTSIRLPGEGDAGSRQGQTGDLHVFINVAEHNVFKRQGFDLYCELDISYPIMVLGGQVTAPTLAGAEKLNIPAGTPSGTSFRIRGKGMPDVYGRRPAGDQVVIVRVAVPTSLSEDQKRVLREYAVMSGDMTGDRVGEVEKGFIGKVMDALR
jgi:molecular chaperone DnaJ